MKIFNPQVFYISLKIIFQMFPSLKQNLSLCSGLTLAGCQVPTKSLYHSPPQLDRGRKIWWKAHGSR